VSAVVTELTQHLVEHASALIGTYVEATRPETVIKRPLFASIDDDAISHVIDWIFRLLLVFPGPL
jgi:hypothetical protein